MKKSLLAQVVLAVSAVGLAACGGGGGGSQAADKPTAPTPAPTPSVSIAPESTLAWAGLNSADEQIIKGFSDRMQPVYATQITGGLFRSTASRLANGITSSALQPISGAGYEFVIPNSGENIVIPKNQPLMKNGDVEIYREYKEYPSLETSANNPSYRYFMLGDSGYDYSQFAIALTNDADPVLQAFYRGNVTPASAMPTSGSVLYRGQIILLPELLPNGASSVGNVSANVDFGSKGVAFAVSSGSYNSSINAAIIGSAFAGKNGSKSIDGVFTGPTAQEMTGGYYDFSGGAVGVFGAKRQ